MRRRWIGWFLAPALMTAAAMGAFVVTMRLAPIEVESLRTPTQPITANPRLASSLLPQPVTLTFSIHPGSQMSITGPGGVVTDLAVGEGARVAEGDLIVRLGNTWAVAMATPFPQWRVLSVGATGVDVESLQTFLRRTVSPDLEVDGKYGFSTRVAVRALEENLGIERPQGISAPSYYAWMPADPFVIGAMTVSEGDSIESGRTVIAVSEGEVVEEAILDAEVLADKDLQWILRLESGASLRLGVDEQGVARAQDRQLLALPEVVEALIESEGDQTVDFELRGSAQLVEPLEVLEVPASAIAQGKDGTICIWLREDAQWVTVDVEILAISPNGTPQLPALSVPSDAEVLVNPNQVLVDSRCRSS